MARLAAPLREEILRGDLRSPAPSGSCRIVRELRQLAEQAEQAEQVRLLREAEARRKAEAEKKQKRQASLTILAGDYAAAWKKVHEEAGRSCASAYDLVCRMLVDLRDAYELQGSLEIFRREFQQFLAEHGRRKALTTRRRRMDS